MELITSNLRNSKKRNVVALYLSFSLFFGFSIAKASEGFMALSNDANVFFVDDPADLDGDDDGMLDSVEDANTGGDNNPDTAQPLQYAPPQQQPSR